MFGAWGLNAPLLREETAQITWDYNGSQDEAKRD